MTGLNWGDGRVQVVAMRSEIEDALKKGITVSKIYRECIAAGTFEGTLRTFERHASKIKTELKSAEEATSQRPGQVPSNQKHQSDKPALPGTFSHSALPSSDDTDW